MKKLRCSCLVEFKDEKLLLVRVRDNEKWYFPGGKIEDGEDPEVTLIRECHEELAINIISQSIQFLTSVTGPAYLCDGDVELLCFSADWEGELKPNAEVSEIAYLDYNKDYSLLAPAVQKFCDQLVFV